jgi:hypothetical protein
MGSEVDHEDNVPEDILPLVFNPKQFRLLLDEGLNKIVGICLLLKQVGPTGVAVKGLINEDALWEVENTLSGEIETYRTGRLGPVVNEMEALVWAARLTS